MVAQARRRRGRTSHQDNAGSTARQKNYRLLRNPFTPQTVFSHDEIAAIHDTALRVLEELGIKVLLPEAIEIYKKLAQLSMKKRKWFV